MLKIAFSWPGNTWKSTLIKNLFCREFFDRKVSYYSEVARKILDENENLSRQEFQTRIYAEELSRLLHLKNNKGDIALIDRTITDNGIYAEFLKSKGIIDDLPWPTISFDYDKVFFFGEPFKKSKNFPEYDEQEFIDYFRTRIEEFYPDAVFLSNGSEIERVREEIKNLLE